MDFLNFDSILGRVSTGHSSDDVQMGPTRGAQHTYFVGLRWHVAWYGDFTALFRSLGRRFRLGMGLLRAGRSVGHLVHFVDFHGLRFASRAPAHPPERETAV